MTTSTGNGRTRKWAGQAVAALVVLLVSACASPAPRDLDYASYEKMPNSVTSAVLRTVLKNPLTAKRSFHGNYGGPGNKGGCPLDEMDEFFRRHDIVYHTSKSKRRMTESDDALVERLHLLDASTLTERQAAYRKQAIKFFNSPWADIFGKPPLSNFHRGEKPGHPFQTKAQVFEFFAAEKPPFPVWRDGGVSSSASAGLK